MSATKNEGNQGSPSTYRPEANAWISKRSSDLDYKGVFALIKIGFLQLVLRGHVVGWCEGAVYLTSLGRPTDIGLQLGKACYPCSG